MALQLSALEKVFYIMITAVVGLLAWNLNTTHDLANNAIKTNIHIEYLIKATDHHTMDGHPSVVLRQMNEGFALQRETNVLIQSRLDSIEKYLERVE